VHLNHFDEKAKRKKQNTGDIAFNPDFPDEVVQNKWNLLEFVFMEKREKRMLFKPAFPR